MALLDLVGRRWTLRILWELREGPLRFRTLREQCDKPSPTILNQRLKELREAEIVTLEQQGYVLTGEGKDLRYCQELWNGPSDADQAQRPESQ